MKIFRIFQTLVIIDTNAVPGQTTQTITQSGSSDNGTNVRFKQIGTHTYTNNLVEIAPF